MLEELDGWMRRKLRCVLWRQWKRPRTRAKQLMQRGLDEARAWAAHTRTSAPGGMPGASHMNDAFPKSFFDHLGLVSLLDTGSASSAFMNRRIRNRTYGGVGGRRG